MNVFQVMGIIVCCAVVFTGVVALLLMQGVHILLALLGVYLLAVWIMWSMQCRARENFEARNGDKRRSFGGRSRRHRTHAIDFSRRVDVTALVEE